MAGAAYEFAQTFSLKILHQWIVLQCLKSICIRQRRSISSSPAWKKLPFHFHCSHVQRGMPSTSQPTLVSLAHRDFFLFSYIYLRRWSFLVPVESKQHGSKLRLNWQPLCRQSPAFDGTKTCIQFSRCGDKSSTTLVDYQLHISAPKVRKHKTSENPVIRNFGEVWDSGQDSREIFNVQNWKFSCHGWYIIIHTVVYISRCGMFWIYFTGISNVLRSRGSNSICQQIQDNETRVVTWCWSAIIKSKWLHFESIVTFLPKTLRYAIQAKPLNPKPSPSARDWKMIGPI